MGLVIYIGFYQHLLAQCNTDNCLFPTPSIDPAAACVLPSSTLLHCYTGATTDNAPVVTPPWCGGIHNNHWFAFIAEDETVSMDLMVLGCEVGDGLQAAIFSTNDCLNFTFASNCIDQVQVGETETLLATNLTVGDVYYLCIDGVWNDICQYSIDNWRPILFGAENVCMPNTITSTFTCEGYSQWSLNPPHIGTIIGDNPGTAIQVLWNETGVVEVCAQSLCDEPEVVCREVTVGEIVHTVETYTVCPNGSVDCAGETFSFPGSYPVTFTGEFGCDSIVTCKINLVPNYSSPLQSVTLCGPAEYPVCSSILTTSGLYAEVCTGYLGCDSIINVDLAILEPVAVIQPPPLLDCGNNAAITLNGSQSSINTALMGTTLYNWSGPGIVGAYNLPNIQVNTAGEYCLIVTHRRGAVSCSDTTCVTVAESNALPPSPLLLGSFTPCLGDTLIYVANPQTGTSADAFTWSAPAGVSFAQLSLDTIRIVWDTLIAGPICVTAGNQCGNSLPTCQTVTLPPAIQTPLLSGPPSFCAADSLQLFTLNIQQPGVQYQWLIPPGATLSGSGDSVLINFANAASGQVCVTPQSACESGQQVCQAVTVQPMPSAAFGPDNQICAGQSTDLLLTLNGNGPFDVTWGAGTAIFQLNDVAGNHMVSVMPSQTTTYHLLQISDNSAPACTVPLQDSLTITVHPGFAIAQTAQICAGENYFAAGALQTLSGMYTDSLSTIFGCDSIVVTNLTVWNLDTTLLTASTCDPSLAGIFVFQLTQANGCDSVVIQNIQLVSPDTTLLFESSCHPADVGVFQNVYSNVFGCDSTVVLTVSFSLVDTTLVTATTCDPAQSGLFQDLLLTPEGCDSLVITTVSLLPSNNTQVSAVTCNPAAAGVFTNLLVNQFGCDSTVTSTVVYVPLDTVYLAASSCDPASTGVFVNTLNSAGGCDSVVVTTVSLLPSNTTQLSATTCDPAAAGVFSQVLMNQFGCDSTVITTVVLVQIDTVFISAGACDPAMTGTFIQTLSSSGGCDSTVVTTVSLLPSNITQLSTTTCDAALSGVFTEQLSNVFGCDSTVITTVQLLPSQEITIQTSTCNPTQAGVFTYPLVNQFGCDSIIHEMRTLLPSSQLTINNQTCDPAQAVTTVEVFTNFLGCDSTVTTVTSLLPPNSCSVAASVASTSIPCGANTGALQLWVTVGEAPFSFEVLQNGTVVASGVANSLQTPVLIPNLPTGTYEVVVTSPNGFSTTAQAVINQLSAPILTAQSIASYAGFDVRCSSSTDGIAAATTSGGTPPFQFQWSNGATGQQISALAAGSYTVTVTDANQCSSIASLTLDGPEPIQTALVVNELDCFTDNNGAIQVESSGGAAPFSYQLNGGSLQTSGLFTNLSSGSYSIQVTDANGCTQTDIIVINAVTPLDVDLGDDLEVELGDEVVLQALVNVPVDSISTVVWTPAQLQQECPECLTFNVVPFVSTVYSIRVESLNGCVDQDEVVVTVDQIRHIYFPNVFSPNGDGENDVFSIFAKPGSVNNIISLKIFDRWGEQLFVLENFQPNNPTVGWDGSYRGQPLTPGVFVWVAEVEFADGEKQTYKGDVTIVR